MLKIGRNLYWKPTAWAPKARRPTLKTAHVRPSSLTIWSNHFLCSLFFQCSNLFNVKILLFVPMEQVFHQFCSSASPSLMVLFHGEVEWMIISFSLDILFSHFTFFANISIVSSSWTCNPSSTPSKTHLIMNCNKLTLPIYRYFAFDILWMKEPGIMANFPHLPPL